MQRGLPNLGCERKVDDGRALSLPLPCTTCPARWRQAAVVKLGPHVRPADADAPPPPPRRRHGITDSTNQTGAETQTYSHPLLQSRPEPMRPDPCLMAPPPQAGDGTGGFPQRRPQRMASGQFRSSGCKQGCASPPRGFVESLIRIYKQGGVKLWRHRRGGHPLTIDKVPILRELPHTTSNRTKGAS